MRQRERSGPVAFADADLAIIDIDDRQLQADLKEKEALLLKTGRGPIAIRMSLERWKQYFIALQRAKKIQRCAYVRESASGEIAPHAAPCQGRLQRSGGLLTCQKCGRVAHG